MRGLLPPITYLSQKIRRMKFHAIEYNIFALLSRLFLFFHTTSCSYVHIGHVAQIVINIYVRTDVNGAEAKTDNLF